MRAGRSRAGLGLLAATALALAGCGGDDDSTSTTAAAAANPGAVQECLEQAGLPVTSDKPTASDMKAVLLVRQDQFDQVYLAFMDDADAAQRIAKGLGGLAQQAGGNAGASVVQGDVVLATARDTTQAQVAEVEGCLAAD